MWSPQGRPQLISGTGAVPDLQPRDGAHPHQTTFDPLGPRLPIDGVTETDQGGLVDEPVGHSHAPRMTSGSPRSANVRANWRSDSMLTGSSDVAATRSICRRRYSVRDRPRRLAFAS